MITTDTGRWFDVLNLIQDTNGFVLADFEVKPYLPCCHCLGVDAGGSADEPGVTEDMLNRAWFPLQGMAQKAMPGTFPEGVRPTYTYKVVLLGRTSVGKSSLAYQYVKNDFKEVLPTVGCE